MKEYSLGLGTRGYSVSAIFGPFNISIFYGRANSPSYHCMRASMEGGFLLVIFTKRHWSESKCEISIQKDRLLRLKCTVRVEWIDTHQYNRCLNHRIDTHQNNRSDWEMNTEIEQLWFRLLPPWSVYVSGCYLHVLINSCIKLRLVVANTQISNSVWMRPCSILSYLVDKVWFSG